ncbi:response regulator transcription factor [Maribacter luteus]|uniref:Response regulator n=1 Tax=Maribacter luteus TaxID=2594478 RepID=A0A6I2MUR7_9FLAO|nr:response regulator transcription factor [Maribacter luteus]MRX66244.1 response regulator [Maribacter luteus]
MKVLIIEDDPLLNENIRGALNAEGIQTEFVFDGQLAVRMLRQKKFDCIVLDINLPGKNGFEICKDFRTYNSSTPVLILTAFDELEDKIHGYDCGADDYLTKPFFMRELTLRIHSLIRRSAPQQGDSKQIVMGDIVIDQSKKSVERSNTEINLTPREYQILCMLGKNMGEIVTKEQLIEGIWGTSVNVNTNTIEVYVNFLRNKIDKPFGKKSIRTKVGYGYYIETE